MSNRDDGLDCARGILLALGAVLMLAALVALIVCS